METIHYQGLVVIVIIILILIYDKRRRKKFREKIKGSIAQSEEPKKKEIKIPKTGVFFVSGFHHLSEEVKRIAWKELKVGDTITLIADQNNEYDTSAIKVMFNEHRIGWVGRCFKHKELLFNLLVAGNNIQCNCVSNKRSSDYIRATEPGPDGEYHDKYLGMAQFIEVKYKID